MGSFIFCRSVIGAPISQTFNTLILCCSLAAHFLITCCPWLFCPIVETIFALLASPFFPSICSRSCRKSSLHIEYPIFVGGWSSLLSNSNGRVCFAFAYYFF